jgi:hypothetical protein
MSEAVNVSPAGLTPPRVTLDCQPILERKGFDLWSRAARVCNELYESLQRICEGEGISALVLKSEPFVYPLWVKFECWIPRQDPALTERASWIIIITPKPFHRYELEYELHVIDRGRVSKYADLRVFTVYDAARLTRYLLRRAPKPHFKDTQLRQFGFQFWKPVNKFDAVVPDRAGVLPAALLLIGLVMMVAGEGSGVSFGGAVLMLGGILAGYFLGKQEVLVRCLGKPEAEPRRLIRVDSWQAVISGLGDDTQVLRERFLGSLDPPFTEGFRHGLEHIWYWGVDGKVEREQFVLTLGRAMVFCQIYQYDRELYAGWDGHLNAGQWVEKTIAKGLDKHTHFLTSLNSVVPGYQPVTEYDITDLNCLIEWTHARLTKLIKELMEERKIDQEVDFKIQRGERQNLAREGRGDGPAEKAGELTGISGLSLAGKLRRTG